MMHSRTSSLIMCVSTLNALHAFSVSRYNKPLRVAEMNTISNSGRSGVSNAFAAALWSLDSTFEVAAAGTAAPVLVKLD
jgi:hypothetical protein